MSGFKPKVEIIEQHTQTPTQALVADAFAPVVVVDGQGRRLEAARLKPSQRFSLKRMMGAEADTVTLFGEVLVVAHLRKIDDQPIAMPTSILQAMSLMDQLGDTGLLTLGDAVAKIYGVANPDEMVAEAKN
jgi:hypothetical protein